MKYVAVEGMSLDFGDTTVLDESVTLGPASLNVSVDGKGVYSGQLAIAVVGAQKGDYTGGTGGGIFLPSAQNVSADGQKVLLEGDEATFNVVGVNAELVPVTWSVTAKISSAGQTSMKAD